MTTLKKQLKRHLGKRTTKRIYAAMPWVGGLVALAASATLSKRVLGPGTEGGDREFAARGRRADGPGRQGEPEREVARTY